MPDAYGYDDGNSQKTPVALSLHKLGAAKANDASQALGKSLPCKVKTVVNPWIVEIEFAVNAAPFTLQPMTVPVLAPPYVAYPIQIGDAGRAIASDYREGALTGQGGGPPNLSSKPGNLSCLGFVWLGNTAWTTPDPDAVVTWGNLVVGKTALGFFGNPKATLQSLSGALSSVTDANAKAVLQSIITALCADGYGLTKDETS